MTADYKCSSCGMIVEHKQDVLPRNFVGHCQWCQADGVVFDRVWGVNIIVPESWKAGNK